MTCFDLIIYSACGTYTTSTVQSEICSFAEFLLIFAIDLYGLQSTNADRGIILRMTHTTHTTPHVYRRVVSGML